MRNSSQKLILHIGRHKTGTTALQYNFAQNQDALAEAGVYYPQTGRDWVAHHDIADRVARLAGSTSLPEEDELLSRFLEEILTCGKNTILVSSEGFQRCDPRLVRDVFSAFDVTVAVYLRDQQSYLQSSYLQAIHAENYCGTIEEYEDSIFSCDYLAFLMAWEQSFTRDKVLPRIFSKDFLESGDIIEDFFRSVLGLGLGIRVNFKRELLEPVARNTSLKGSAIAFKKRLNKVIGTENYYSDGLYKALGRFSAGVDESVNLVSRELARKLKKKYRKSNRKVLKSRSLPASLLDFKKVVSYQTIPWMSPSRFYEILLQLIDIDDRCKMLLDDCYSVEIQRRNGNWKLDFCPNISADSLPQVRIRREGICLRPEEFDSFQAPACLLSANSFDPQRDEVLLEFDSGKTVNVQKIIMN